MADVFLHNSLSRKKEKFVPINPPKVGMYTCGPTVYNFVHIGNFRTYTAADLLVRVLSYNSFDVKHVMNLTDVGHLTGDNEGDADHGEDRIEKSAKKQGKSALDIAKFYSDIFLNDMKALNIRKPWRFPTATGHIPQQVELVRKLEAMGLAYKTSDGIYFDTKKFEKETGKKYGEVSTLDEIKEGARVAKNEEKKSPRDFALWKFSKNPGERQMEWESPWGVGFPGWHVECSAMAMEYLGDSFDIHVGGEDLKQTHHPNEIAQSEAVTGKQFVKYWIHPTFMKVEGRKMSKSLGNIYTVADIVKKGIDPMALRYLYLTAHYRDPLNFTWKSLEAAQNALNKLKVHVSSVAGVETRATLSKEKRNKLDVIRTEFVNAVNNDLDTPKALASMWKAMKSNIPAKDKYDLVEHFDEVFGLGLVNVKPLSVKIPKTISTLVAKRELYRKKGDFDKADEIRQKVSKMGYIIEDSPNKEGEEKGPKVRPQVIS